MASPAELHCGNQFFSSGRLCFSRFEFLILYYFQYSLKMLSLFNLDVVSGMDLYLATVYSWVVEWILKSCSDIVYCSLIDMLEFVFLFFVACVFCFLFFLYQCFTGWYTMYLGKFKIQLLLRIEAANL